MFRIKLIVTGAMEKATLHESLQRVFQTTRAGRNVQWDTPQKISGATTHRLSQNHPPSRPMRALAKTMLAEVKGGKTGKPADMIVAVDDLELGNLGHEAIVVQHFRSAMNLELAVYDPKKRAELRACLGQRCSFHLLSPMVESYLFGDPEALLIADVPRDEKPRLVHPSDVEQFETNDPAWLKDCNDKNMEMRQHSPWWCHERHPKAYLEHLVRRGGKALR